MKLFVPCILLTLFIGCKVRNDRSKDIIIEPLQPGSPVTRQFYPREVIADTNLVNTSGHRLFVMYNSVSNFFPVTDSVGFGLSTECMYCEAIEIYNDHLVFGSQFEIFDTKVMFHDTALVIPENAERLKRIASKGRDSKPNNFVFSRGLGQIKYAGQSCIDAELNSMTLTYKTGQLKIKNLLNAEFFEFDMNRDGVAEQYILATRNCSHELAVLKIE